jgi:hypothetical protein
MPQITMKVCRQPQRKCLVFAIPLPRRPPPATARLSLRELWGGHRLHYRFEVIFCHQKIMIR